MSSNSFRWMHMYYLQLKININQERKFTNFLLPKSRRRAMLEV